MAGSVELLREFLNVDDDGWVLLVAFLDRLLPPGRPFPVLQLHGEQGTPKSTPRADPQADRPNKSPLRKAPKTDDDLMVSASKSWVMTFENISHLEPAMSDAVCRLSTGGGLSKRALFTDEDEIVIDAIRPVIITSIGEVATRGDLLDRALLVELPIIDEKQRLGEKWFWRGSIAHAQILGAVLDAVAGALRGIDDVRLDRTPRMADFAEWAAAAEGPLGWEPGSFMRYAYSANRSRVARRGDRAQHGRTLVCEVAEQGFEGRPSELLELLWRRRARADGSLQRLAQVPAGAHGQAQAVAPNLRARGTSTSTAQSGR